jgi:hypothetical protein
MVGSADRLADLVRFHLVYRSSPGESTSKQRPTFYSKDLALASRLVASAALPAGDRVLYALRPAAATHMETGMLAPSVDWAAVAASYGYAPEGSALGPR